MVMAIEYQIRFVGFDGSDEKLSLFAKSRR